MTENLSIDFDMDERLAFPPFHRDLVDVLKFQEDEADDMRPARGVIVGAIIGGLFWLVSTMSVLFLAGVLE